MEENLGTSSLNIGSVNLSYQSRGDKVWKDKRNGDKRDSWKMMAFAKDGYHVFPGNEKTCRVSGPSSSLSRERGKIAGRR